MDCKTPLNEIIERCQELGIDCVAIADHGTAEGALKMRELAPFKVIIAEEILTPHGEIMGMFLQDTIPSHISVEEAIARIREQGGLVNIPHPFDTFRGSALDSDVLYRIADQIDLVEVLNARSLRPGDSTRARKFAAKYHKPGSAGSDAHTTYEIGNTFIELPEFETKEDFLESLRAGRIHGGRTNPLKYLGNIMVRINNRIKTGRKRRRH
jgi:predicted metal-dependent phosphoesterase TrpH